MASVILPLKLVIYAINLVLWCLGLAMFSVGVWIRSDQDFWEYQDNLNIGNYYAACYILIIVGAVLLVCGFIGCIGVYCDSTGLAILMATMLFLLMVLNLTSAGLSWKLAQGQTLQDTLRGWIEQKIGQIVYDAKARRFMDLLQIHLQCCGATSKHDYEVNEITIPQSCSSVRTNNVFIYGCSENLRILLERTGALTGGLSLFSGLIELIGLITYVVYIFTLRDAVKQAHNPYVYNPVKQRYGGY